MANRHLVLAGIGMAAASAVVAWTIAGTPVSSQTTAAAVSYRAPDTRVLSPPTYPLADVAKPKSWAVLQGEQAQRDRFIAAVAKNKHDALLTAYYAAAHVAQVKAANEARKAAHIAWLASQQQVVQQQAPPPPPPGPPTSFGNLQSVVDCIKSHESGNYSESSHPGSGSGAYQFIPDTWRSYDRLAGYPGGVFNLAYEAPPWVQDAVLAYALTHGGAGNWSTRWGNDPCTAGLPGGG